MKTYTLFGSMRFEKEMREIAYDQKHGKEILYHCKHKGVNP